METNRKMNLFVVGAMRAGTTSLMKLFENHPEIYTSPIKEPHFFVDELPDTVYSPSSDFSTEKYFARDFPKKLHIGHVRNLEQYQKLLSLATTEKYRVEASTCYLHEPNAADKINVYHPEAKIIILLRAPFERAYSQYMMNVGLGRESRSFNTVMQHDLSLWAQNKLPWYSILYMSCYDRAVQRFQRLFKNVAVICMEDFSGAPETTFQKLEDFLQITPFSEHKLPQSNASYHLKNTEFVLALQKTHLKQHVSKMIPSKAKRRILKMLSYKDSNMVVAETLRIQLEEVFKVQSTMYY